MDTTQPQKIMQRWRTVQYELLPELRDELGALTPKLEQVIHTLEWLRIEEFTGESWCGVGRPPVERGWLANAFVAKAVLGLSTTVGLIERLSVDRALRRICGFPVCKKLPSEATFSRAFEEFSRGKLGERVHAALITEHLGEQLIGHISRDGTAIESRERPSYGQKDASAAAADRQRSLLPEAEPLQEGRALVCGGEKERGEVAEEPVAEPVAEGPSGDQKVRSAPVAQEGSSAEVTPQSAEETPVAAPQAPRKRGRRKAATRPAVKESPIARQRRQTLAEILQEIPTACDRGTKSHAQGYKVSWNGYKLHIDTADCGVPVAALLSSASMHDSLAAVPLSRISAERVTNLYDLMDAAYCSTELRAHSRSLNHVPLIDHNPRRGEKIPFAPAEAVRYNERSAAERTNARLKDEFGGNTVMVRGAPKVMAHLMFGLLSLAADQLMRLRR